MGYTVREDRGTLSASADSAQSVGPLKESKGAINSGFERVALSTLPTDVRRMTLNFQLTNLSSVWNGRRNEYFQVNFQYAKAVPANLLLRLEYAIITAKIEGESGGFWLISAFMSFKAEVESLRSC